MRLFLLTSALIIFNTFCTKIYCQQKDQIGINVQIGKTPQQIENISSGAIKTTHGNLKFGFGILYEKTFSKHSGCEIELKYRHATNDLALALLLGTNNINWVHYNISENFLSVPITYKYRSKILNVSAGPSLDYFLSWKQHKETPYNLTLPSYTSFFDKKISVGVLATISKTIPVDKKISIEPSLYCNPILSFKRTYYGVSIATKYTF
ncbi:hypothetical protein FC093_23405 [Ilyomonas limi]|uniref:Outer membrane protein beta-barrel domain-containing protein n=1 Tax=Ilyomonas limi TaxID=2575867 RepID=A0A4U3KSS8_9BACT|nr:hypothetical protein [Ilyomonas limi]TKK64047.1 hypothetical protein FC093_23405 [Ilyomonas limi]